MRTVPSLDRHLVTTLTGYASRILRIENWAAMQAPADVPFSGNGAVQAVTSNPFLFPSAGYIVGAWAALGTAGSTGTTLQLNLNGSLITGSSFSLAASATSNSVSLTAPGQAVVAYSDVLTVVVTAAGTGAQNLTVHVQVRYV